MCYRYAKPACTPGIVLLIAYQQLQYHVVLVSCSSYLVDIKQQLCLLWSQKWYFVWFFQVSRIWYICCLQWKLFLQWFVKKHQFFWYTRVTDWSGYVAALIQIWRTLSTWAESSTVVRLSGSLSGIDLNKLRPRQRSPNCLLHSQLQLTSSFSTGICHSLAQFTHKFIYRLLVVCLWKSGCCIQSYHLHNSFMTRVVLWLTCSCDVTERLLQTPAS